MTPKIMVVEDEQSIRDIISEFLTEAGYSVTIAVDGIDALEKIAFEQYDLYVLDIYMPRMDGLELILKIKEIQPLAVVVVTTGFSSVDVAIKAIRAGAYHYLTKPIQSEELIKVVRAGLKHAIDLSDSSATASEGAATRTDKHNDMLLLRGFTQEQVIGFRSVGILTDYNAGEIIPLDDTIGSLIFVEGGALNVIHNGTVIDSLKEGDVWGEETFINSSAIFTTLKAQTNVQIRHFQRRKIMDFFNYSDETLTKRYMINLIQCQYMKWRRSIYRIGLFSGFSSENMES